MQYFYTFALFFFSAVICWGSMLFVTARLRVITSNSIVLVLFCMGLMGCAAGLEMMAVSLAKKMLFTHVAYIAYTMLLPSWVLFMLEYTLCRPQYKNPLVIGLYGLFGIFLILNWTNPHNLFYEQVTVVTQNGVSFFSASYGPIFWLFAAFYYAVLVSMSIFLIIAHRNAHIRRNHVILMLAAVYIPILGNIAYMCNYTLYDYSSVGFIISCLLLFFLYRYEFFAEMPLSGRNILGAMTDGIILTNARGEVVDVNRAATQMLYIDGDPNPHKSASERLASWPAYVDQEMPLRFIHIVKHPVMGQRYYRVSVNLLTTYMRGSKNYLLLLQDETALHHAQERLEFLEQYDPITGLYNRQYFLHLLEQEIERCQLLPQSIALVCASVINHRDYCYVYGNSFGSKLMREVGGRIKGILRKTDAISCFSDDEFVLFLRFDAGMSDISNQCDKAMARIYDLFTSPVVIQGVSLTIRLRSGVAFCPQHTMNSGKLTSMAHSAKLSAADSGKRTYTIYRDQTDTISHSLLLEQGLHKALERNELYLVYHPQVDIRNRHVVGVEALLRWTHPDLGPVSPSKFIPIAEENGLIHPIGLWVIEQAIAQMKKWKAAGIDHLRVSANISLSQLTNAQFASQVLQLIEKSNIDPHYLELEVTESLALFPEALTHRHLETLRQHGVRIAMDDFGMGHSSLTYIKQFPLDAVKIDRTLSADLLVNQTSVAMVQSIRTLCQSIGMDMVIEFIEHVNQLEVLKEIECYIVQGYVFSPPLLPDACLEYILRSNSL